MSAALAGSSVEWLSVEVTASDIPQPVVATIPATGGTAQGSVVVPSGPARTFVARGYDTEGTLTHRAEATADVAPGTGAAVALVLRPVGSAGAGGDDRVALASTEATLAVGATRRIAATVTRADGTPVSNPTMVWATLDPAVATVSPTGLITAIAPGTTQVIAISGGGAAVATITVGSPVTGFALASIAAGANHSCGLTAAGKAYCWGGGGVGQLGTGGTVVTSLRPLPVSMSGLTFTKLALGLSFSCGLASTGTLYCWGTNGEGQLGIGSTTNQLSPTPVPGGAFTDVVANDANVCGLRASTWYCWGRNDAAQTGQPTSTARVLSPTAVPVVSGETWSSVAMGGSHACALSTTGAVYCWGNNTRGQLGSSTATSGPTPVRVDFPGATPPTLTRIVAGSGFTCALEAPSNAMWCWGDNSRGQQAIPVSVPTTPHRVDGDFSGLVAGASFACAVGRSVCWGDNNFGELGDGTLNQTGRSTPAAVAGGAMQAIAPGVDNHMCGLRDGVAWCWGLNGARQLGDGTTTNRSVPVTVLTP